jgi:hypothetical protein
LTVIIPVGGGTGGAVGARSDTPPPFLDTTAAARGRKCRRHRLHRRDLGGDERFAHEPADGLQVREDLVAAILAGGAQIFDLTERERGLPFHGEHPC